MSPFSPAIYPHKADIIHGFCFSKFYNHKADSTSFSIKDTLIAFIKEHNPDLYMVRGLYMKNI